MSKFSELMQVHHYEYLDELRESGETNMYGAAVYLQGKFGIDRQEARKILQAWMDQFSSAGGGR